MNQDKKLIKVWDYMAEYNSEREEIHQAIEEVLSSGWLILGNQVRSFEEEFSNYCGVDYGVGVNSGTDALFLGLKALDIGIGDEVITVSNTAVPTVSAIVSTGATPVFVDVNADSYLMDVEKIEEKITTRTKCILPVHLFGQCVDMVKVNRIAKENSLFVMEDCAQGTGAEFNTNKAGSMSDVAAFSFYPTKILGGYGDGGMVVTKNKNIYDRLKKLRMYGMEKTYYAKEHGYNSRLDEMQAAILRKKLMHLDGYINRRRKLAANYNELLMNTGLVLPKELDKRRHAYYIYVVRHPKRDFIIQELRKSNIHLNISYPWPIHTMEAYSYLGYKDGDLPVTESLAKQIFSIPMYPYFTEKDQNYFSDIFHEVLGFVTKDL